MSQNVPGDGGSRPAPTPPEQRRGGRRRRGVVRLGLVVAVLAVLAAVLALRGGASPSAQIARQFATAWASGNWQALYGDVDTATQLRMRPARFARDYAKARATATVTRATVLSGVHTVGGLEAVRVRIHTRAFGTFDERFMLPIAQSGNTARVLWGRWLVFPGMYAGETLHRHTSAPARGRLLARDRVPLATLPAADDIVGSLGPASVGELAELYAEGFPADTPVGEDGLQYLFQRQLAGKPGGELLAGARVLARSRPKPGEDVTTSLDPELQNDATAAFGEADGGIVVMVPKTGELLAVAGSPLSQLQPPGSTFKIVTITGVLRAGLANPESTFPDATYAVIDGYKLHNSSDEDCGGTLANAFAVSCNSVFAPLGVRLGATRLLAAADAYGFNSPSPLAIAAESTVAPASALSGVNLGSSAIGQYQDLASPLQMARIAATIALGGREPVPTFDLGVHRTFPRVIPATIAHTIRRLMLDVVSFGTGTRAQIPGVEVAGKTGTAQITVPACPAGSTGASGATGVTPATGSSGATGPCADIPNNPYDTDAWFVTFAPAYDPAVVVGVLLDHDGMGGASAAPVAKLLLEEALPVLAKESAPH
jgi:peptidoglycan glycosyltransferase